MTFIPDSFLRAEAALTEVTAEASNRIEAFENFVKAIRQVDTKLGDLTAAAPTGWADAVSYINAQATANPGDEVWQELKRRKDKIVADFQAKRAHIQAVIAAIDAV